MWNQALLTRHSTSRALPHCIRRTSGYPAIEAPVAHGSSSDSATESIVTEAQLIPPLSRRAALARDTLLGGT